MKKRKKRLQCLISFTIIINMTFMNVRSVSAANSLRVAKIKSFSGTVKINKAGGEKNFKAVEGMSLVEGDSITTEKNSSITLYIDDDKEVKIGDNSMVNLSQLSGYIDSNDEQTGISLWVGRIWSNVKKKLKIREKYEIKVPTAVMGVRGTEFSVESDADSKIEVAVLEGVVTAIKSIPQDSSGGNTDDNTFEITITKNEKALMNQQDKSDKDIIIKNVQAANLSVFVLEILKDYNTANPGSVDSNIVKDIDNAIKEKTSAAPSRENENIEAPKIEMDYNVATGQEKVNLPVELPQASEQGSITETIQVVTDTTQAVTDTAQAGMDTIQVGTDTAQAVTDTTQAVTDTAQAGTDTTQGGTDTTQAGTHTTQEGTGTTQEDTATTGSGTPPTSNVTVTDTEPVSPVQVNNGVSEEVVVAELPSKITLNLSDGTKQEVFVTKWVCEKYDENTAGEYTFTAEYNLPDGVMGSDQPVATTVTVLELIPKPVTVLDTEPVSPVEVNNGVSEEVVAAELPSKITLNLSDGTKQEVFVTKWVCEKYDESTAGGYTFTAEYGLPDGVIGSGQPVTATVTVLEPISKPVTVLDVESVSSVQVNNGVSKEEAVAELPSKITLNLSDGTKQEVPVIKWDCEKYDENIVGEYAFTAEYSLPSGVTGTAPEVTATVTVLEPILKPVTVLDVEPVSSVQVNNGVSKLSAVAELPQKITLNLSNGTKQEASVITWECTTYSENKTGEYIFTAVYNLPSGVSGAAPEVTATVIVLEPIPKPVTVLDVEPVSPVEVNNGVSEEVVVAELPSKITLNLSDGTKQEVFVTKWVCEKYDESTAGGYTFTAEYSLPDGISGSIPAVTAVVTVLEDGARTMLGVNPVRHVVVQKGTIQSHIELPSRIGLYLSDGTYEYVNANWSCENYDGNIAGMYVFTALYALPNRIIGSGLTVNTIVTVLETNIGSATGESVTTVDKIVEP